LVTAESLPTGSWGNGLGEKKTCRSLEGVPLCGLHKGAGVGVTIYNPLYKVSNPKLIIMGKTKGEKGESFKLWTGKPTGGKL